MSQSETATKRRTAVEKHKRLWYNTHITVLKLSITSEYGHSYTLLQQYVKNLKPVKWLLMLKQSCTLMVLLQWLYILFM